MSRGFNKSVSRKLSNYFYGGHWQMGRGWQRDATFFKKLISTTQ